MRQSTRQPLEPLNILTFPSHERYESGLALTGNNFYAYRAEGIKDWNTQYASIPENYVLLNYNKGVEQIPTNVDFDLILSQNKFGQFQIAHELSRRMHLPLVSLEHTLPIPSWTNQMMENTRRMRGDLNVFISDYSVGRWGFDPQDPTVKVIHHMVDTDIFTSHDVDRDPVVLSIVNDWVNRDWCCNFQGWKRIVQNDIPVKVRGDTPGLSTPTQSTKELVTEYQNARIFLNTSTISPVPTSLLEAMACGCAVVSTATCMIPEIINNGVNGFVSNDENKLREYCKMLLNEPNLCNKLGNNARETIINKFNKNRFTSEWNTVFRKAANTPYIGR